MSYSLDIDPLAQEQIGALPPEALRALPEAFTTLQLTPWNGPSANPGNPAGAVRMLPFGGPGLIEYLIQQLAPDPAAPLRSAPARHLRQ